MLCYAMLCGALCQYFNSLCFNLYVGTKSKKRKKGVVMAIGVGSNYSVGIYHTSKPNLKPQEKRLTDAELQKNIRESQAKQPKQRLINGAELQKNIRESQVKQPKQRLINGAKLQKNIRESLAKQLKKRLINGAELLKNIRKMWK